MSDIEKFKLAVINTAKNVTSQLGISYLNPLLVFGLKNMLEKPKYSIVLEALTDSNGNLDINTLTKVLEETIGMKGGRFTIAGVTFTSDDVENLKKEYLKL